MARRACAAVLAMALSAAGADTPPLEPARIAELARGGGLVFLTTHGESPYGSDAVRDANADAGFLADCARQRQLSEAGRAHARAFGEAVRRLQVPFDDLLASPYCRARETLELAFPGRPYASADWLRTSCFAAADAQRERRATLARQLATAPAPGGNTLLMTHFCNLSTFARRTLDWCGIRLKPGTSVVYRPVAGSFEAVGCVPAETWRDWGR